METLMPIFKLKVKGQDLSDAELIEASKTNIDLEDHLEAWLERSPWAIAQEPLMLIGRQSSASLEGSTLLPDLVGLDKDGNLVVIELKKGRTPREVVAQLLEYAAWASELSDDSIEELAGSYLARHEQLEDKQFSEAFCEVFEVDEIPTLNQNVRLFIAAEDISPTVSRVCRFLRTSHGVDLNCVQFSIYKTESGEILISSEMVVGQEEVVAPKKSPSQRWSGDKPVRQVVWEAIQELTKPDPEYVFSPKEVSQLILGKYPSFNKSTVGCQIISDCLNHSSRHHYPGGEDRYWWVEKGRYRLYMPERDKLEAE
jgi:hypothetical protein